MLSVAISGVLGALSLSLSSRVYLFLLIISLSAWPLSACLRSLSVGTRELLSGCKCEANISQCEDKQSYTYFAEIRRTFTPAGAPAQGFHSARAVL